MNAYVSVTTLGQRQYHAEVVGEDDYFNRGPHAHSYRTPVYSTRAAAVKDVEGWLAKHPEYQRVPGPEAFCG